MYTHIYVYKDPLVSAPYKQYNLYQPHYNAPTQ